MDNPQVFTSAQRGLRPSPSHRIKTTTTKLRERKQPATAVKPVKSSRDQVQPITSYNPSLKRNRGQQDPLPSKRPRTSTRHTAVGQGIGKHTSATVADPVQSWVLNKTWPVEYFEPDDREPLEPDSWSEEMMALPSIPVVQYTEMNGFRYPLPIRKLPTSLRREQPDSSLNDSSGQKSKDSQNSPYRNPRYKTLLETKGSFLYDFGNDYPPTTVTTPGRDLLSAAQAIPQDSLFRYDIFRKICRELEDTNKAMVVQDVSRLLVPSAKHLAMYGDRHLDILIENVNEIWTESIPVEGPQPQPDYSVGFKTSAFTNKQLSKLGPLIGRVFDSSFFVATYRMLFPFLTCEVKCGDGLDIADRENAHSMTIAVRSVVELYKTVKREKELDREILGFSISHNHRSVRIYGHYPVIDGYGDKVTFYRHLIRDFSFVELNGWERWTSYKFTKNVYDIWMPKHLKRICSAIDQLPSSLDLQVSNEPGAQLEEASSLSQDTGSLRSDPDIIDLASQEDEPIPIPRGALPECHMS